MKRNVLQHLLLPLFLINYCFINAQTTEPPVNAGSNKILDWEYSQSLKLEGKVSPKLKFIKWSCSANTEVKFQNPTDPGTIVTFPRTGYFLLRLSAKTPDNKEISSTVVVNVFKPNTYKERLTDLVNLMTIDEKIGQLVNQADAIPRLKVQAYNYWSEALHGILGAGTTSFPQAVALGSSWDPDLVNRIGVAISDEARILNITEKKGLTYWSPTVNIARDPRWGRNEESYSEDPYLLSKMGVAFIKGMQGNDPYYLKVVATPKHFIANNEERRRHNGSADIDMRSLWEYYMPAFKSAIVDGKAYSIMGAYNALNQVPACGNYYMLTDVLRRQWGFNGYVVSDCGAIHDMVAGHHFFDSKPEASARGILAGCDLNCGDYYKLYLKEALNSGYLHESDIDTAVFRVLAARFRLGEFDPSGIVPYSSIPKEKLDGEEHRKLALDAARKSIVLLKNNGILPVNKDKVKSIAVIGPNAAEIQLGIYSGWPNVKVSPLQGIRDKAASIGIKVEYAKGSEIGGGYLKPIAARYFGKVEGSDKTGMKGEYYNNPDLSGTPVLTRIDSVVNFSFGIESPAPEVVADKFSVRWTGKIIAPETRTFSLGTRSDDGSRLYLNGKLLFDDWTEHGEKPNFAKVDLEAGKEYDVIFEYFDSSLGASARLTWDKGEKDFDKAVETAKNKDLVILILGTFPGISEEELDRTEIELPEVQRELIQEIAKVNSNIVVVLINGGPVALSGTENLASAIVEAWYAGQSSGTAIADVLFGDVNPGGKLPETFYASTKQLPSFADYNIINNERSYMYFKQPVLFPFGHGLSFTTFEYSNLKLSASKIDDKGQIDIQCAIKNTGKMKGDEVVQVYFKDLEASVKVPIHKLLRFQRISLEPGESKILTFSIPASELSFYDIETNKFIVEPGEFEIQIGSSSSDIRLKDKFTME